MLSKLYWVSGNARGVVGFQGEVRVEMVYREQPHPAFDYFKTAKIGNRYDAIESGRTAVMQMGNPFEDKMQQIFLIKFLPAAKSMGKPAGKLEWPEGKFNGPGMYFALQTQRGCDGQVLQRADGWGTYVDLLAQRWAVLDPELA